MPDQPLPPYYDPYLPTVQDTSLWWWQGRPCRIVKVLNYGDRQRVQIDLGGGQLRQVDRCELSDRNIINIPDDFRVVMEALRNLLVKMQADPLAGQYSFDEIVDKLQLLADSITGLQQQLQTVQWGNIQGSIASQADLQSLITAQVSQAEFNQMWEQAMALYLQRQFHSQPGTIPPFNQ